jgi:hypothetical protein
MSVNMRAALGRREKRRGAGRGAMRNGVLTGSFYRAREGHQGGVGGVTVGDIVVFNGRIILGSSWWVKARLEKEQRRRGRIGAGRKVIHGGPGSGAAAAALVLARCRGRVGGWAELGR